MKRLSAILTTLLGCIAISPAHAVTQISWFSAYEINSTMVDSNGIMLSSSYAFELGTFATLFVPTASNTADWAANWKRFDLAADPVLNSWDAPHAAFTGSQTLVPTAPGAPTGTSSSPYSSPAHIFTEGDQLYVWAYNTKTIAPGAEWALVTDTNATNNTFNGTTTWTVPTTSQDFSMVDADTIILGGLYNTRGPGGYTATPGVFSLQTSAVPEPGSLLAIASLGFTLLVRRRQKR
jgi:hypothetical protein